MSTDKMVILGEFDDQISPALKTVESGIIRLVGSVSAALTAIGAIVSPVTVTASFQREMLEVQKTTDFTSASIRTLGQDLVDLSKRINVAANDLAKIAALGGQLGVGERGGPTALLAFTEEISRAVTALDVNAEEAATSLGKLINIFDIPEEKYRNVIAAINELSNVSTAKPEELFDIMRRIGNLGGSVTVDQSAALSATMIDLGLTAETAGTSLTKVFADMKADASSFAALMGVTTTEWSELVQNDGVQALEMYLRKLNELPPAIAAATKQEMTGGGRIFELITKLQADIQQAGGGTLNRLLITGADEFAAGTSAIREQQTVLSGLSAQWDILINTIRGTAIEAGTSSLGTLTEAVRRLSVALDSDAFTGAFGDAIGTISSAVGGLVDTIADLAGADIDWRLIIGAASAMAASGTIRLLTAGIELLTSSMARSAASAGGFIGTLGGITTAAATANAAMTKVGQGLTTTTFINRADQAMRLALEEQRAWEISRRQLESQLGAYRNFMMRRADLYRTQNIDPLEAIQANGGTLTRRQNSQLQAYRLQYQQMVNLSRLSANEILENEQNLIRLQRVVRDRGFAAELEAYRRQRQMRNMANIDLQDTLTDLQGNLNTNASGGGPRGFTALIAGVREFMSQNQAAYVAAQAGATRTERAMVALRNAINTVTTSTINLRTAMLQASGDTARFAAAQGTFARTAILMQSGSRAVFQGITAGASMAARGLSLLGAAISRAFTVVAVVQMGLALLDMIGLLDTAKKAAADLANALGFKTPDFLKTTKEVEAQEAATRSLREEYERIEVAAERFQQKFGTVVIGIEVNEKGEDLFVKSATKALDRAQDDLDRNGAKLKFDFESPEASSAAFAGIVDTLSAVSSQAEASAAATKRANEEYSRLAPLVFDAARAYRELEQEGAPADELAAAKAELDVMQKKMEAADKLAKSEGARIVQVRSSMLLTQGLQQLLSALNQDQASQLFFSSVTDDGRVALDRIRELDKATADLKSRLDTEFKGTIKIDGGKVTGADNIKDPQELQKLQLMRDEYSAINAEVTELRNRLLNIPGLAETLGGKEQAAKVIMSLTTSTVDWRKETEKAVAAAGGIEKAAKGLGTFTVPVNLTKTAIASSIRVALEYRNALTQMVGVAEAAAKDSANAMNRAMERHKQDVRDLAAFTNNLTKSLSGQTQRASSQVATRALEDSTRSRIDGLNTAKALEGDILRTIQEEGRVNLNDIRERLRGLEAARDFGREQLMSLLASGQISQEVYNRESKALDDNVSKQRDILNYYYERGNMTREEAKAISSVLDIKYRAANQKIMDSAELEKSQISLDGIRSSYGSLKTQAEQYKAQLTEINAKLADESIPVADRASLLEQRNQTATALRTTLASLRQETEKFASTDPVAGKVVVKEDEVRRMEAFVKSMTDMQGQLDMQSAGLDQGIYERVATKLQAQVAAYDQIIKSNVQAAEAIKMPVAELERLVAAAAKVPEVARQLDALRSSLATAATGNFGAFQGVKLDPATLVKQFQASIDAIPTSALNLEVPVLAKMSDGTLATIKTQLAAYFSQSAKDAATAINAEGGITIEGKVKVTEIDIPGGKVAVGGGRGGATGAFATGGPVYGAGTATSDSIPAWLSHGEYVMDARTTRMFSPAFFAKLQELARRGVNLSGIRTSVRGFANGGLATGSGQYIATTLNSISESAATETVAVDLNLNGSKRARLRGSREQVDAFAQALREVQKGIAR